MTFPRRFALDRSSDMTGISGTGIVAYGCKFADGTCVLRWNTQVASTVVYAHLDHVVAVHGHDGATRVVWLDDPETGATLTGTIVGGGERRQPVR